MTVVKCSSNILFLKLDELRQRYDAVVLSYGAAEDRRLGIPGEDLDGELMMP